MDLKWQIEAKAARISWSNVEYFCSVTNNFKEKNQKGCQPFTSFCCRMPPVCVSEVSVARESSTCKRGCAKRVAVTRVALMAINACCMSCSGPVQVRGATFVALSQRLECAGSGQQEPTVKMYHTQKALELLWCVGLRDRSDGIQVVSQRCHAAGRHPVAKEGA